MYKKSKNPKVEELTKNYKDRIYAVSRLPYIKVEDQKRCIWCGDPLKTKHPAARYCKDEHCMRSAYAWANPQGDDGKLYLLERQDYKCNICQYDWTPNKNAIFVSSYSKKHPNIPRERRPEVDHIVPISKGGQSLGLDNHQAICYTCHKAKTKIDNSGPRTVKELTDKQFRTKIYKKINRFYKAQYAKGLSWEKIYELLPEYFNSEKFTNEELERYGKSEGGNYAMFALEALNKRLAKISK